ncbi:RNA polymerase factor sigma-54 [Bacillus lacus]|uniref:RNA polymerase factor sigma-54 n=1 Tax=Metabacillus lacus TaxID=1983721 RepID=A0A7X2LX94_9BACI|nr:RNA polymerase factor sigma-54 [Metabacillus lacus]MRX72320.1 RNA polymerase factor sigma-54 [Metabacillus lacus]
MKMNVGLFQEQSLKLNMTQELKQAITLLQYSAADLSAYLQEITLENPLIELRYKNSSNVLYHTSPRNKNANHAFEDEIDRLSARSGTLRDHLREQLVGYKLTKKEAKGIAILLECVDRNGYLLDSVADIAESAGLEEDMLQKCLPIIQSLEPAGIGARNLQECILLQLRRLSPRNEPAERVISDYFTLFAEKSWKQLSLKTGLSLQEIQLIQDDIKALKPRPGLAVGYSSPAYVIPDLVISLIDGEPAISYQDGLYPEVVLNKRYVPLGQAPDEHVRAYIGGKLQHFKWISKSLQQRKETMLKVMREIAVIQREYLCGTSALLKPLTMREIADRLSVHESTISRTVKDKYIQTPHGMYEMKFFFSNKLQQGSDEIVASSAVKTLMTKLINSEDEKKPFSDQAIANALKVDCHIEISRRTVAKYREQLKIPASSARKRY